MAYREKVWNANVLTDLLSTYLTHKAGEREKYYQAEVTANKPIYRTVDKSLYSINPATGEATLVIQGEKTEKEPEFEEFTINGMINKGRWMGKDYTQSSRDKEYGMDPGYRFTGSSKRQFKEDDPNEEANKIEQKNISAMVSESTRLKRLRDKDYDAVTWQLINAGFAPPAFTEENQKQLDFYEKELVSRGFDVYGKQIKNNQLNKDKSPSELLNNLNAELTAPVGKSWSEEDAKYYYSDKGTADIQKIVKEFEAKYPPGTYDPLSIDMERERFWYGLTQKYLPKDSSGLSTSLGGSYRTKYNFDNAEKYGRGGTLDNPATGGKKGSFWD